MSIRIIPLYTCWLFVIVLLATCVSASEPSFSNLHVFNVNAPNRVAQGIATDTYHIFVTTSINESGMRENIISVYDMEGKFVKEKRNATTIMDRDGRLMDFGDAFALNGSLYVTLYNWNSLPKAKNPLYSKIAVFSTQSLALIDVHDIGGNTAEGVTFRSGSFWAVFHDKPILKQFDINFKLLNIIPLKMPQNVNIYDGYFEGITWYGKDIFVNIHGPNHEGSLYSPGVVRYHYNGSGFTYVQTLIPPTYGSGQGIDSFENNFYFVDRPANVIVEGTLDDSQSPKVCNAP